MPMLFLPLNRRITDLKLEPKKRIKIKQRGKRLVDFTTKMNETKMCSNFVSNIPIYNDGTKKKPGRGGGL